MGDRLRVETSVLREAGRSLRAVYGEFSTAHDTADVGADVIAHGGLRGRVHDFGSGWNTSRNQIIKAIEGLGRSAEGAAEAYEEIETELVAALEGTT